MGSVSFPINTGYLSIGLTYAPKGKLTEQEPSQLTTLQKGGSIWGLGLGISRSVSPLDFPIKLQTEIISTQTNLSVSYGKLIRDRLVLGGSFAFINTSFDPNSITNANLPINSIFYTLGVFLKKYYTSDRLTPFSSVSLGYGQTNPNITTTIAVGGEAGLAYLISNHFFVEATLASATLTRTAFNDDALYTAQVRGALSPSLRLQYVFR